MQTSPSTLKIFAYNFATLGLYFFYWCSRSRGEINKSAKETMIPTTWLLAVPMGNYWWMWKYGVALETVSFKRIKGSDIFLFYLLSTSFWLTFMSAFDVITPQPKADTTIEWGEVTPILIGLAIVVFIVSIIGNAFFCAVAQNKINKLRAN